MSTIRTHPADSYVGLGILFTLIVGIIMIFLGLFFAFPQTAIPFDMIFVLIGLLCIFLAFVGFIMCSERLRRATVTEALAARGPAFSLGILMIILGAIIGAAFMTLVVNAIILVAFLSFIAGIFFILAHSNIQVEHYPAPGIPTGEVAAEIPTPIEQVPGAGVPGEILATIEGKQGSIKGQTLAISSDDVTIGRRGKGWRPATTDIALSDATISRPHAKISLEDGNFYISDLNSRNLTYLDGVPLTRGEKRLISDGSKVKLGKRVAFTFRSGGTPVEQGGEETPVS